MRNICLFVGYLSVDNTPFCSKIPIFSEYGFLEQPQACY